MLGLDPLVVSSFTLVTGGSAGVSTVLALVPVAAYVLGCVLAGRCTLQEEGAAARRLTPMA